MLFWKTYVTPTASANGDPNQIIHCTCILQRKYSTTGLYKNHNDVPKCIQHPLIILPGDHLSPICADSSIARMYKMCSISNYEMFLDHGNHLQSS